MIDA
jgi:hypothetical protein